METIAIPKGFKVTPEQFEQLAHVEQLARMELTKDGELIVMSPTGGTAGRKNRRLTQQIGVWTDSNGTGEVLILLQFLHCLMAREEVLMLVGLS